MGLTGGGAAAAAVFARLPMSGNSSPHRVDSFVNGTIQSTIQIDSARKGEDLHMYHAASHVAEDLHLRSRSNLNVF